MRARRQLHMLFVAKDEAIVGACTTMLEGLGHAVTAHAESLKALKSFSEEPDEFDLAIVDHDMPDIPGLELGERLRRIRPGFPVMLFSGHLDDASRRTIEAAGVAHVVLEPVTVKQLEKAVRTAL